MKKQSKSNINSPSQVGRNTQTQGSRNFNKKSAPFFHYLLEQREKDVISMGRGTFFVWCEEKV